MSSRRLPRLRTLALMLPLSLGLPSPALWAAPASAWVETESHAMNGLLADATDLGAAPLDTPLPLLVSLKLQNTSLLYGYFQHLTDPGDALYGHYLRPDQFAARYSPSMAQVSQVTGWLHAMGFSHVTLSPNRTVIRMDGTVGLAQQAFATRIHRFTLTQPLGGGTAGSTILANVEPARVPASLGSVVLSVAGLNTLPSFKFATTHQTDGLAQLAHPAVTTSTAGITADQYQHFYDTDPAVDGSKTPIAIIAEGDVTQVMKDLVTAETMFKLPQVPFTVIPTGYPHVDTAGATEFDLDTQSSTGLANNVSRLYVYDSGDGLGDRELIDAFNRYVTDDLAVAASASFGTCETIEYENGELSAYDQTFLQMATQGQTLFSSSGDVATACAGVNGIPAGVPGAVYPASSPYVVGVGGTTVTFAADNAGYGAEAAWRESGGGVSRYEPTPAWQSKVRQAVVPPADNSFKGFPDVSMDGGTSAAIIVKGKASGVSGTSLSSPLAVGAWARMQSAHDNKLGFAPPAFYALAGAAGTATPGFHDIVTGNNVVYSAVAGYDYVTGLGTFDIAKITALLQPVAATLPPAPKLGGSPCTTPGDLLAVGVKGSQNDGLPTHNALDLYIAEPLPATTNGKDSFVFTLEVDSLALVPPSTAYFYYFLTPDGTQHYLEYSATPSATGSQFTYGTVSTVANESEMVITRTVFNYTPTGDTDTGSQLDTANNRIVWVLAKSEITGYTPDSTQLTQLYGEVDQQTTGAGAAQAQATNQPVDDTPQGIYSPVGNTNCLAATMPVTGGTTTPTNPTSPPPTTTIAPAPVATMPTITANAGDGRFGGALGAGALAPLVMLLAFRRRRQRP